ncbi:dynein light chain Tctex-type 5-B-like [Mytilus californianus]|uniref:dynein light chain Tctex-type 5-B-like n=1 Tax=Mytilus californianus TaxID=6549 RepID=UPI002247D3DA|nr:dynein light chain Tctex-type 5-B-like [Mytilus californianus]
MSRRMSNLASSSLTRSEPITPKSRRMRGSIVASRLVAPFGGQGHTASNVSDSTPFLEITSLGERSDGILHGKKLENTFKIGPDKTFKTAEIERATKEVLSENLKDVEYNATKCRELSQDVASKIMEKIKILGLKRYKVIAVVSIGSLKEKPGMQFGSRCLWNKNTDNFTSVKFSNNSIFSVAMVYGLYFE